MINELSRNFSKKNRHRDPLRYAIRNGAFGLHKREAQTDNDTRIIDESDYTAYGKQIFLNIHLLINSLMIYSLLS